MSKITRPNEEPSVTCGFYDGLGGDRKYYASQMATIFDGIIKDGVFASIGDCFVVTAGSGSVVNVGTGKCWFNHTWTLNDGVLPIDCGEAEIISGYNRIDAIVITVDATETVRDNFIELVKGTPASTPVRPTLVNNSTKHQYPLCYIYRASGVNEITQSNITNMVGSDETPFITGILQTVSLDKLLGQWRTELDEFVAKEESDLDTFMTNKEKEYNDWYNKYIAEMQKLMTDVTNELDMWTTAQKNTILAWFDDMKGQLSTDAAVNLQLQINEDEIERILMNGFPDGTKTFSDDGTVITSEDSTGRKLVKTFTNNFLTSTTILTDSYGTELGRLVKNFSSDCKNMESTITIN